MFAFEWKKKFDCKSTHIKATIGELKSVSGKLIDDTTTSFTELKVFAVKLTAVDNGLSDIFNKTE